MKCFFFPQKINVWYFVSTFVISLFVYSDCTGTKPAKNKTNSMIHHIVSVKFRSNTHSRYFDIGGIENPHRFASHRLWNTHISNTAGIGIVLRIYYLNEHGRGMYFIVLFFRLYPELNKSLMRGMGGFLDPASAAFLQWSY